MPRTAGLVTDANALIDYASTDESVLALAARHLGPVIVPSPVLDEVEQLDIADCERLGIRVVDPTLEQLLEAASQRGALSFEDRICLIIARDAGWTCVTSDRRLRAACEASAVSVMWSLELVTALVDAGELSAGQAVSIAEALHAMSPWHITLEVVAQVRRRVEGRRHRS
jgi:predicted nucleic acid-binding protein